MKEHVIEIVGITGLETRSNVASEFGHGRSKRLVVVVQNDTVRYEIFKKGVLHKTEYKIIQAAEAYNTVFEGEQVATAP